MNKCCVLPCLILAIFLHYNPANAQLPPRLNIPGAVLVSQPKPQYRQQRIQLQDNPPPRLRRPPPQINAAPAPIRPVVEDVEEQGPPGNFEDELSRLGLTALANAVRQQPPAQEDEEAETSRPIQFRPERPVPVLRSDVRENPRENLPPPPLRSGPLFRDALPPKPNFRQENNFINRPVLREELPAPRAVARQSIARQNIAPQPVRQPARSHAPRPAQQYVDDDDQNRRKKPVVQILSKYRTDNEDGSITWGFENEDGTFKEETLGTDCVTRGKYGYIDPDGVKREYNYETGNKCDQRDEEDPEQLLDQRQPGPQPRKPAQQPQFRPQPVQYRQ